MSLKSLQIYTMTYRTKKIIHSRVLVLPYTYLPWLDRLAIIILFISYSNFCYNLCLCGVLTLCVQLQVPCNRLVSLPFIKKNAVIRHPVRWMDALCFWQSFFSDFFSPHRRPATTKSGLAVANILA